MNKQTEKGGFSLIDSNSALNRMNPLNGDTRSPSTYVPWSCSVASNTNLMNLSTDITHTYFYRKVFLIFHAQIIRILINILFYNTFANNCRRRCVSGENRLRGIFWNLESKKEEAAAVEWRLGGHLVVHISRSFLRFSLIVWEKL